MIYAVILAGGSGTRLWPRSRERMPKQFLDITGNRTMLQEAVDRIEALIPLERVFVITNREYLPIVRQQLPALPEANAIGEIMGRGTAPAIGLAAITLRRVDPDATMVVLTADHLIGRREDFRRALAAAAHVAESGQSGDPRHTPHACRNRLRLYRAGGATRRARGIRRLSGGSVHREA